MMIVRMILKARPEKQLEVLQTFLSLWEQVKKDPGCKSFCVFCDIDDKTQFTLLEEWETSKDMDNHIQSLQFGVLLGVKTLLSEPPRIEIHTVSHTRGMDIVQALREKI